MCYTHFSAGILYHLRNSLATGTCFRRLLFLYPF
nr:MAG TPA: hypothetical protein [Caudoviricetes sp.]